MNKWTFSGQDHNLYSEIILWNLYHILQSTTSCWRSPSWGQTFLPHWWAVDSLQMTGPFSSSRTRWSKGFVATSRNWCEWDKLENCLHQASMKENGGDTIRKKAPFGHPRPPTWIYGKALPTKACPQAQIGTWEKACPDVWDFQFKRNYPGGMATHSRLGPTSDDGCNHKKKQTEDKIRLYSARWAETDQWIDWINLAEMMDRRWVYFYFCWFRFNDSLKNIYFRCVTNLWGKNTTIHRNVQPN